MDMKCSGSDGVSTYIIISCCLSLCHSNVIFGEPLFKFAKNRELVLLELDEFQHPFLFNDCQHKVAQIKHLFNIYVTTQWSQFGSASLTQDHCVFQSLINLSYYREGLSMKLNSRRLTRSGTLISLQNV